MLDSVARVRISALFAETGRASARGVYTFAMTRVSRLFGFAGCCTMRGTGRVLGDRPSFVRAVISPGSGGFFMFARGDIRTEFFTSSHGDLLRRI